MQTGIKNVVVIFLISSLLSACGKDSGSTIDDSSVTNTQNSSKNDPEIWSFELVPVSNDYDTAGPVCGEWDSNLQVCEFRFNITNISKIPQEILGNYYLETSDGRIFQGKYRWYGENTALLNPGEWREEWIEFRVPRQEIVATKIFRGWGATDLPIYTFVFPIRWNLSD